MCLVGEEEEEEEEVAGDDGEEGELAFCFDVTTRT